MSAPVLHQFAISHYCEKVRWALDLKGIEHRARSHVPGVHARTAKRLTGRSSVPVLELDGEATGESSAILDRLDTLYPEPRLTPAEPALAAAAREHERRLDEVLGTAVRRVCYATLLDHRDVCVPLLAHGGPWYGRPMMTLAWPKLAPMMRRGFGLTASNVARARADIERTLDELERERDARDHLVGGRFTRADLTAASLLAPLTREKRYGIAWPERLPDPLGEYAASVAPRLEWVGRLYAAHRPVVRPG